MKKCILYGNCQAEEIAKVLSEHKDFSRQYEIVYVCSYNTETRGINLPTAAFSSADLLIYQPLRGINIATKNDCIALTFPYIYNAGAFAMYEEDEYVKGAYPIRKLKWQGVPVDSVIAIASSGKLFFNLQYRFDISFDMLFKREQQCDIKISHLILDNYTERRVFFTQNHVSNLILFGLINGVLERIGLNKIPPGEWGPERMSFAWPVSEYDVSELGYKFGASEGWFSYMEHCIRRIYAGQER